MSHCTRGQCGSLPRDMGMGTYLARKEGGVAVAKDDQSHKDQADPGRVWLEPPSVRKAAAVHSLGLESLVKADVGHAHDNVLRVPRVSNADPSCEMRGGDDLRQ